MQEQRTTLRRRTLLDGRIEVEKLHGWGVDCAVRNVSAAGARVALHGRASLPQHFRLGISGAAPRTARLVWYRDGHAGIVFVDKSTGGVAAWDGICRRVSPPPVGAASCEISVLQARIEAIAAGRGARNKRRG